MDWALNDESRAFGQRFFKLRGAMPTAPQAAVYSGVSHYLKAVAEVGTDATDPVLENMRSMPVDDFYARGAKVREDGKLVHDFYLVQVKNPSEVKAPWDYYNVLEKFRAARFTLPWRIANARWSSGSIEAPGAGAATLLK